MSDYIRPRRPALAAPSKSSHDKELSRKLRRPSKAAYEHTRRKRLNEAIRAQSDIRFGYLIGRTIRYCFFLFIALPLLIIMKLFYLVCLFFKHINAIMVTVTAFFALSLIGSVIWLTYLTYWK